jgi:preprotein translocase subunit YajC
MHEFTVLMPLAQMNATVGGTGGNAPPAAAPAPAPAAPVSGAPAAVTGGTTAAAPGAAETSGPSTTAPGAPATQGAAPSGPSGFGLTQIVPIILMIGLLYVFLFRGQRKEEKKRKQMISELKKGDRIMTIGGMIARVVSIDGEEVVLKIDESANVKATYTKRSIQEVLDRDDKK